MQEIKKILKGLDTHNVNDLARRGQKIRELIVKAQFPDKLKKKLLLRMISYQRSIKPRMFT